jgi:hypothetical protein
MQRGNDDRGGEKDNTTLPASFLEALDTVETSERQLRLSKVDRTGIRQVAEER